MKLTKKQIDNAQPKKVNGVLKDNYLKDGGGLYLIATPKGSKIWRYHFSFNGKKYKFSLGLYPRVTLQEARKRLYQAKVQKAMGTNPVVARREAKREEKANNQTTFSLTTKEYFNKISKEVRKNTMLSHTQLINRDFIPSIGNKPISTISKKDIVDIAKKIEKRGSVNTAHRAITLIKQIFNFAYQNDMLKENILSSLKPSDVLAKATPTSMKTLTKEEDIKALMRFIKEETKNTTLRDALLLMAYTGLRTINITTAKWSRIDLTKRVWVIPKEEMKNGEEFTVYLSNCSIDLLMKRKMTSTSEFVFPSSRTTKKPISKNSLSVAISSKYKGVFTPHGFRAMLSTLAYENGEFRTEVIEATLSHSDTNKIRKAYNRAKYEDERKTLMDWWCNKISF